jgi:excisionase family DNA binding protein
MDKTAGSEIESFVDADRAAEFLGISRRHLLELARGGDIPAHPIGTGKRKTWRFRLSEIADAISTGAHSRKAHIIGAAVPGNRIGGSK